MPKRMLLAALLGGVAMFLWGSLAHVVLPIGEIGVKEIPNEQPVLEAMRTSLGSTSGLYLFPGMGLPPDATSQQRNAAMQQYDQKLAGAPSGLLIYHPPGAQSLTPAQLLTEFGTNFLEALLAVYLLSQTRLSSFGARVMFVTLAGVMAGITTNLPYWNWYGFPTNYTLAYMGSEIVGYVAIGVVAALILKKHAPGAIAIAA